LAAAKSETNSNHQKIKIQNKASFGFIGVWADAFLRNSLKRRPGTGIIGVNYTGVHQEKSQNLQRCSL
jgi:hypothetical protein